jgi:hypothetical protein
MSNTIIIGVLIGAVLLGAFGAIVPLVLISSSPLASAPRCYVAAGGCHHVGISPSA